MKGLGLTPLLKKTIHESDQISKQNTSATLFFSSNQNLNWRIDTFRVQPNADSR